MTLPYAIAPVQRDDASAAFFDATAQGRLTLRRCDDCGHVRGFEVPMCTECLSEAFTWFDAAGTGHLESWIVQHPRAKGDAPQPPPQMVATVELDEGPWMLCALIDVDPAAISYGMALRVDFVRPEGSEAIPVVKPA
jgi:uncharacterized protein